MIMAKGNKTGGRNKGTPNQITKELRTLLKDVIFNEIETLPEQLNKLDTKDRLEIITRLLPFILPKCLAIDAEIRTETTSPELTQLLEKYIQINEKEVYEKSN